MPSIPMMQKQCTDILEKLLGPHARQVEADLERWLVEPGVPDSLAEAMRYCALGGGKRIRPALLCLSAEAAGTRPGGELLRRCAVAVELVHCYSLVHDDLPTMDDDELRRGRPTAHVQFGEAMAILTGDALLTRAMGVLAESDDPRSARVSAELARASGPAGMIAGQVADMDLCELAEGAEALRYIHLHKTAALIRAAARMGAICAEASEKNLQIISDFAGQIGLIFQLIDDMLDVTGTVGAIGKTPGKDATSAKRTHVALLGLERTAELGRDMTDEALRCLEPLGPKADPLRRLAEILRERTY